MIIQELSFSPQFHHHRYKKEAGFFFKELISLAEYFCSDYYKKHDFSYGVISYVNNNFYLY
jgi:hypothetical protein